MGTKFNSEENSQDTFPDAYEQMKQMLLEQEETIKALEQAVGDAGNQQLTAEFESLEMHQILSATADPIWAVRDDGIVIRANQAMLDLLGKDEFEVIGQRCSDLINFSCCQGEDCPLKNIKKRQRHEIELFFNGEYYSLLSSPLITIVGTEAVVGHFRNITFRKQTEQQLEMLNKKLAAAANIDGLTQIANRRSFNETFEREWLRHKRNKMTLSLVLIDIDFFKKYNDYYGHSSGDDCLIKVASALQSAVKRPVDLAARYGGEEFVVLLPETPIEGAICVAERIAEAIAALRIEHHESEVFDHVTVSQGAASIDPDGELKAVRLIEMADEALYAAKERGRNCYVDYHTLNP